MNFKSSLNLALLYYWLSLSIEAAEGMPQFNVKSFPSQLFWLILTFSILYVIVSLVLLPRIRENIRLRKNKVSNNLERAEAIQIDIKKMIEEYESKIIDAKDIVSTMIKKSMKKSTEEFNNQVGGIKKKIENKNKDVEKKLHKYQTELEESIVNESASVAAQIIKKIINKDVLMEDIKPLFKELKESDKN